VGAASRPVIDEEDQIFEALCVALGHDPDRVDNLTITQHEVIVEYRHRLAGVLVHVCA